MLPINEIIYENNIRRQIFLLRHRNGLSSRIEDRLKEHDQSYSDEFLNKLARLSNKDLLRLTTASTVKTDRLDDLLMLLAKFQATSYELLSSIINTELDKLTFDEYQYQNNLISSAARQVDMDLLLANPINFNTAKEYRSNELAVDVTQHEDILAWSRRRSEKILSTIRNSLKIDLDLNRVTKDIYGTEKRFSGIMKKTHFGATLISNTLHVSATSAANLAFIDRNSDFDLLVSCILDSGTSSGCFNNHHKFSEKDLNGRRSPFHKNCRARSFPYFMPDEPPKVESVVRWWSRQDDEVKIKVLGKKIFEMYKENPENFSFPRDFISPTGDKYTLQFLEKVSSGG